MHNIILYWRPATEIFILWLIIYRIMIFFDGTRANQVLRGVMILLLSFFVFQKLHLAVLNWLLEQLFGISVVAILIIFHPEIRQGLAKLGKKRLFRNSLKEEEMELILNEICQACDNLTQNKIGALVVLEKDDPLTSYIQSGVSIDAHISAELIQAIFTPNNPLHDGAIIIQQKRISAAGCILPLSDKQEINRVFGTRHRAAIGLSEETDALIIVISEERQDISLIYKGKMFKDLNQHELISKIKEAFKDN